MARVRGGELAWADLRQPFFDGFHHSLVAFAGAGNNLIVEHIFDGEGWLDAVALLLEPFDVFFVGLHCSLQELTRRQATRGDRPAGSAERDFHAIHRGLSYDLEVQSEAPLEANVERVLTAWRARQPPSAFADLARTVRRRSGA